MCERVDFDVCMRGGKRWCEGRFSSEFRSQRVFCSHRTIDISNVLWLFNPEFILSSVEGAHNREILINIHVCWKLARFININFDCCCGWKGSNLAANVLALHPTWISPPYFPTHIHKLTSPRLIQTFTFYWASEKGWNKRTHLITFNFKRD